MSEVTGGQEASSGSIQEAQQSSGLGTDGAVVKAGGDSATSFDDFEAIESYQERKVKAEVKEEIKEEKLKAEVKKELKGKSDKKDKPKEESEDSALETEEEKPLAAKAKGKEEPKEEAPPAKELEFTVDGKQVKLKEDAKIKVKVDGEEQEVTIADLRNSWSGHQAVKKRFDQFNQEKQSYIKEKTSFVRERQQLDDHINEIHSLAAADPEAAVLKAVELIGGDPNLFIEDLKTKYQEEQSRLANMSEAERAQYYGEKKAELFRKKAETLEKQIQSKEHQAQLDLQIKALQKEYTVDDDTFDQYADELIKLKNQGKINRQITPEYIVETILTDRRYDAVEGILGEIDGDLSKNQAILDDLVMIATQNPDFSMDDMRAIIFDAYGDKAKAQIVNARMRKSGTKKPTTTSSPQNEDVFNFEQL